MLVSLCNTAGVQAEIQSGTKHPPRVEFQYLSAQQLSSVMAPPIANPAQNAAAPLYDVSELSNSFELAPPFLTTLNDSLATISPTAVADASPPASSDLAMSCATVFSYSSSAMFEVSCRNGLVLLLLQLTQICLCGGFRFLCSSRIYTSSFKVRALRQRTTRKFYPSTSTSLCGCSLEQRSKGLSSLTLPVVSALSFIVALRSPTSITAL